MARTILFIGGNSGIGLATAHLLKSRGDNLIAAARTPEPLAALGIPVQPFDALSPMPLELPPMLEGLVYFPGSISLKPFHRLTQEDFLNDFRINCLGAVAAIQAALPALKAAESASIVLFSTIAVAQGLSFHASIAAAKAIARLKIDDHGCVRVEYDKEAHDNDDGFSRQPTVAEHAHSSIGRTGTEPIDRRQDNEVRSHWIA